MVRCVSSCVPPYTLTQGEANAASSLKKKRARSRSSSATKMIRSCLRCGHPGHRTDTCPYRSAEVAFSISADIHSNIIRSFATDLSATILNRSQSLADAPLPMPGVVEVVEKWASMKLARAQSKRRILSNHIAGSDCRHS